MKQSSLQGDDKYKLVIPLKHQGIDGRVYDSTDWMYGNEIWIHKMPDVEEQLAQDVTEGVEYVINRLGLKFKIKYVGSKNYMEEMVKKCTFEGGKFDISKMASMLIAHQSRDPKKGGSLHADIVITKKKFFGEEDADAMASYLEGLAIIGLKNLEEMILSLRQQGITLLGDRIMAQCAAQHETYHLLGYFMHHEDSKVQSYPSMQYCNMNKSMNTAGPEICDKCLDAIKFYWKGIEDRTGKKFFKNPIFRIFQGSR